MRVTFRQGIVSHESPNPFELVGGTSVNIIASNRPVTATIAHRDTNYIHSENSSVSAAWTGSFASGSHWLYWDFDLLTFARTFDTTTLEPISQAAEPSSPANGQMWYDTANHVHYVRSAGTWVEVLRVFAAKIIGGALSGVAATGSSNWAGTQISDNSSALAGRVLFDEASDTIIRDDRTLFTTEDQFFSAQSRVDALRLESNVSRALSLDSLIAAFTVVAWKDDGKVSAAEYDDVGSTVVGMLTEQIQHAGAGSPVLTASETGAIITQGTVTNPDWTWTNSVDVGAPLWVNAGVLVTTDPHLSDPITYSVGQVPVARVLSIDTIIFEQGLGGKGDTGPTGPTGPSPAATTTTLGSVVLSATASGVGSPPSIDEAPVVVETSDPRLTDARSPLTHNHNAVDIIYTPSGDVVSTQLQGAVTELDLEKLAKAGGTMTGTLVLNGDPSSALAAATKQYVDAGLVAVELNDLTDVIVAGSPLVADQVLTFNGTNWINAETSTVAALNDLTDVIVAGSPLVADQVLTFNGTNWINAETSAGGLANIVEDTTPQLGGDLDVNGFNINGITPNASEHLTRKDYVDAKTQVNWTTASPLGNGLAIAGAGFPALAALNETDIAFIDSTNDDLRTYRFDGTDWLQVGSGLAIATVGFSALTALNETDVAFIDDSNDSLRTYRFAGSPGTWSQVGSGLTITGVDFPALAALNETDVAFFDRTNDSLRTYRFAGSPGTWSQVGNGLAVNGGAPAMTALNGTDIAFIDRFNDDLRTYRFDGTDWSQVGNELHIESTSQYPALATLNGTDVAFVDDILEDLRTYRFDGTDWSQVGTGLAIGAIGIPAMGALNGTDVAFTDSSNGLRTYRFDATLRTDSFGSVIEHNFVNTLEPTTTYGTTGAIALDMSAGTYFTPTGTTTGIITFSFTNPAVSGNVTAFTMVLQGAGDNAPVWPAGIEWPAATEPTWTAGGKDVVSFITTDGGTTWLGMLGGLAFT